MSELLYQTALSSDDWSLYDIVLYKKAAHLGWWGVCLVVYNCVLAQEGIKSQCVRGLFVAAAQLRCLIYGLLKDWSLTGAILEFAMAYHSCAVCNIERPVTTRNWMQSQVSSIDRCGTAVVGF